MYVQKSASSEDDVDFTHIPYTQAYTYTHTHTHTHTHYTHMARAVPISRYILAEIARHTDVNQTSMHIHVYTQTMQADM